MAKSLFCAVLVLLGGCSQASSKPRQVDTSDDSGLGLGPSGGSGTAGKEGGAGDAGDSGSLDGAQPTCNALMSTGVPSIDRVSVPDAPPAPIGGTIVDGTYQASKYEIYTGAGGQAGPAGGSIREVYALAGSAAELVADVTASGTTTHTTIAAKASTAGTNLTLLHTCPDTQSATLPYSVINGTTLLLFTSTSEILTLTKQ